MAAFEKPLFWIGSSKKDMKLIHARLNVAAALTKEMQDGKSDD